MTQANSGSSPNGKTDLMALGRNAIRTVRQVSNYSLRTKLILTFLAVALLPLALLVYQNDRITRETLENNANQMLRAAALQAAASLDTFIETNLQAVGAEAQLPALVEYLSLPSDRRAGSPEEAEVTAILRALSRKDPVYISSYALLDRRGVDVVDTSASETGGEHSGRRYFETPLRTGQAYVSPVEFSPGGEEPALYFSNPVLDAGGDVAGVLRVRYDANILQQLVGQSHGLAGEGSFAVLFDENYIHLAHTTAPEVMFKAVAPLDPARLANLQADLRLPNLPASELSVNLPDLEQKLANVTEQPFFTAADIATGDKINQVAATRMETQPWLVAFFQPQEVFLAPAVAQTRNIVVLALLIAGVVVATAVGVGRLLADPISRLTAVARQAAEGDLTAQARVEFGDEIGVLANTLNMMTSRLHETIDSLEERVAARTRQLETVVELGRRLSAILDLSNLMREVVAVTKESFDYYHVHIYLLDEEHQILVIAEGYGEAGAQMRRQGHNIPLFASQSLVARAAREGRIITVENVGEEPGWLPNPLLPDTRSEMAVPIMLEERVVGVLDVQSEKVGGLTLEDEATIQALANQIAVAVRNARLFTETQEALYRAQKLQQLYASEAWSEIAPSDPGLSYQYSRPGLPPLQQITTPEAAAVLKQDRTVVMQARDRAPDRGTSQNAVATPLKLHDAIIGVLGARDEDPERRWTEDEIGLIETVAEQMSLAIENARLFEKERQTTIELRATDRLKSEFLTTMSHELRTPLNSIIGFSEVLLEGLDGELSEHAIADVMAIHTSGQHLLALINDILDLAKIEAGRMELVRKPVAVNHIMEMIRATSASLVKDKPVELIIPEFPDLPLINVDETRIHQIILNLVSNATKFTEEGYVKVNAWQKDDKIIFSVKDTGAGIPESSLDTIFERFRQVDGTTTRRAGGTGLGLTITRHLVEMHGGEIWVESEQGKGSTFFFSIPIEKQAEIKGGVAMVEEGAV
ncbi:MAG: ATP-binding protein [Anaerolineae bacterium]